MVVCQEPSGSAMVVFAYPVCRGGAVRMRVQFFTRAPRMGPPGGTDVELKWDIITIYCRWQLQFRVWPSRCGAPHRFGSGGALSGAGTLATLGKPPRVPRRRVSFST